MNVFVLCTGRSGSMTFANACRHATNYTVAHESGVHNGYSLKYADQHIEVDNRLAWFPGRLSKDYPAAYYVHLLRNRDDVARSFARRGACQRTKLLHGFMHAVKQGVQGDLLAEAKELVDTVNANIRAFLENRPHATIQIEDPAEPFARMWNDIGAEGNLDAAIRALGERHNRGPA